MKVSAIKTSLKNKTCVVLLKKILEEHFKSALVTEEIEINESLKDSLVSNITNMTSFIQNSTNFKFASDRDPDTIEFIKQINSAVTNIRARVQNLNDFKKLKEGKIELCQQIFDIRQAIYETIYVFSVQAFYRQIQMEIKVQESLPKLAYTDRARL
jgi:signal transduction histidine kinase